MGIIKNEYIIRNYQEKDAEQIASYDFISMLAYRFNDDYVSDNIFCAVNGDGEVLASAHIAPDQSWSLIKGNEINSEFIFKLVLNISVNDKRTVPTQALHDLYNATMARAREIRSTYPNQKITISHTILSNDHEEMELYISKGFTAKQIHLVMTRDLTEPIPHYSLPAGVHSIHWKMDTEEEQMKYLEAESAATPEGACWSLNHLQWTKSGNDWGAFTAFSGNDVVGSVMSWGLGDKRSATENIFVLPGWRNKGIARALISEALAFLKEKGITEATLSVAGGNRNALALYQSLGYRILFTNIEFGYDL